MFWSNLKKKKEGEKSPKVKVNHSTHARDYL